MDRGCDRRGAGQQDVPGWILLPVKVSYYMLYHLQVSASLLKSKHNVRRLPVGPVVFAKKQMCKQDLVKSKVFVSVH